MGFAIRDGQVRDLAPRPDVRKMAQAALRFLPDIQLTSSLANTRWPGIWVSGRRILSRKPSRTERIGQAVTLPHPSPRNNMWLRKIPGLRRKFSGSQEQGE
jgi:hypothetical protein